MHSSSATCRAWELLAPALKAAVSSVFRKQCYWDSQQSQGSRILLCNQPHNSQSLGRIAPRLLQDYCAVQQLGGILKAALRVHDKACRLFYARPGRGGLKFQPLLQHQLQHRTCMRVQAEHFRQACLPVASLPIAWSAEAHQQTKLLHNMTGCLSLYRI